MQRLHVAVALLALACGVGLGRATAPDRDAALSSIDSFRAALAEPDWLVRSYRFSGFLRDLSPSNLPEAVAAIEEQLPWLRTEELRIFMLAWVRFDPQAALDRALHWPKPFHRNASGAAVYAWAMQNPAAAQLAVSTVADADLQEFLEGRMLAGWTHGPFKQGASDYIASMPEGSRRFRYLSMLAWELSKEGPTQVHRWAEAVPDGDPTYKAAVFLKAASTLAAIDPAGTAAWLAEHAGQPYSQGAMRVVVRSWALQDPAAALAWLAALAPGKRRDAGVFHAFEVWHREAPGDARRWLREATPDPALDPAVRLVVGELLGSAPEEALVWAGAIADPARRAEVTAEVSEPRQGSEAAPSRATDAAPLP